MNLRIRIDNGKQKGLRVPTSELLTNLLNGARWQAF